MEKSGYYFTEMMPTPGDDPATPGIFRPERWTPYKVWAGDLWTCPDCGAAVVVGTGRNPISEHYMPEFPATREATNAAQLEVKDC
jgi:hypothetical protein